MLVKPIFIAVLITFLCSCISTSVAPVDSRQSGKINQPAPVTNYDPEPVTKGFHKVVQGDTLYSISWRYGLDYREIGRWNNTSGSYLIYPGQNLRLIPGAAGIPTKTPNEQRKPLPVPQKNAVTSPAMTKMQSNPGTIEQKLNWRWPTNGRIIKSNSPIALKGLDITGNVDQDIYAAANGTVVYRGSGLLGYGNLIIIKHNDTYLSAYAHNKVMGVKEGEKVNIGQKIGTMGTGIKDQPLLHFEIRKEGKPVNPLQFLPKKS
jgi:lipoprotein NlpD